MEAQECLHEWIFLVFHKKKVFIALAVRGLSYPNLRSIFAS